MAPNKQRGLLLVISGPSGVGKDTILQALLAKQSNLKLSVSATTRPPRSGEKDKIDYYFLSKEDFSKMIQNDELFEYAEYCGNFYGTPKKYVDVILENGNDVILEIETQGALQVIDKAENAVSVFILPPSFEVLRQRLENRHTDSDKVIQKRLKTAEKELSVAQKYDYIVVNDDINECVNDIISIIKSEKLKTARQEDFIKGVLENAQAIN